MTRKKLRHEGLHTHRFKSNPLERLFAEAWDQSGDRGTDSVAHTLDYLLDARSSRTGRPFPADERDRVVAATVIQWLGSPVGINFLKGVLKQARGARSVALRRAAEDICHPLY